MSPLNYKPAKLKNDLLTSLGKLVLGTQKNHLNKMVLLSIQNIGLNLWITFTQSKKKWTFPLFLSGRKVGRRESRKIKSDRQIQ